MARLPEPFKFNTHELARRAGEMKEYELDIELLEKLGVELISVPAGEVIEVDARLESVTEGILLTADIFAIAKGECTRCLDPVEIEIERKVQELYYYAQKLERPKKKKRNDDEDDLGEDDELMMDGDIMDLEPSSPPNGHQLPHERDLQAARPTCHHIQGTALSNHHYRVD